MRTRIEYLRLLACRAPGNAADNEIRLLEAEVGCLRKDLENADNHVAKLLDITEGRNAAEDQIIREARKWSRSCVESNAVEQEMKRVLNSQTGTSDVDPADG